MANIPTSRREFTEQLDRWRERYTYFGPPPQTAEERYARLKWAIKRHRQLLTLYNCPVHQNGGAQEIGGSELDEARAYVGATYLRLIGEDVR